MNASARILLAGDYAGMPFTEGAAETGRWAARTIAAQPERAPAPPRTAEAAAPA